MSNEETELQKRSHVSLIYKFLGGAALGALVISIPFSYSSALDLSPLQMALAGFVVVSSGVLTSLWGQKFIDAVTQMLNGFAP